MHKNVYTSDMFETWRNCKKKYYLKYIKRLRMPENNTGFELGKSVHALMNYYLGGYDIKLYEQCLKPDIDLHWRSIKNHPVLKNKYVFSEWGFNSAVGNTNYWLNGRIDAVFYDEKNEKYIIADWKTGQNLPKSPENSFQTMLYLYSFFRARKDLKLEIEHDQLSFLYIKTPECTQAGPILYSKEKEDAFERIFLSIIDEIRNFDESQINQKHNEETCKFCPYKGLCSL